GGAGVGGVGAGGTGAGGAGAAGPGGACTGAIGAADVGGAGAGDPGAGGAGAGDPGVGGNGAGGAGAEGTGAGGAGASSPGGVGVPAGAGGPGGAGSTGCGGARTRGTGAAGAGGVGDAGAGDPRAGGTGAGGARGGGGRARGTGAGGAGTGGAGAGGTGAGDPGAGGAGAGGAGASGPGAGATVQRRPFFVPPPPSSLLPPSSLQPDSPLPTPSPYAEQTNSLIERREPQSCPASPVRAIRTGRHVPRPRPPPVPGTHIMALSRAASPTFTRLLAIVVTDPLFESIAASALIAELVDFAAACRLDYAASLVAESEFNCPPSVGGECALGTDFLDDRQEDFEFLAATVPHLLAMLLAPEGDPDAPDIPTPRSYAEAITGPYSSQWQTAMDAEMASWKSTGTYVDAVPPPRANIVDGMWIFR
ncbi:unnamed protein product, partial [Closterium sp. NIES-53]